MNIFLKQTPHKSVSILIVIYIVAAFLLVSLGITYFIVKELKIARVNDDVSLSFFAAESGIERGLKMQRVDEISFENGDIVCCGDGCPSGCQSNPHCYPPDPDVCPGNIPYTLQVKIDAEGNIIFESIGKKGIVQKKETITALSLYGSEHPKYPAFPGKEEGESEVVWLQQAGSPFNYRKAIILDNTQNSSILNNYQILLTIDTASLISSGKMQSQCQDIRITKSDGTTTLPYWIESGCNTASTNVWTKIPSIPANSQSSIYLYYGNENVVSEGSGSSVFEFFDDFNTDLGYAKVGSGNGNYAVSNSIVTITETQASGSGLDYGIKIAEPFKVNGDGTQMIMAKFKPSVLKELHGISFINLDNAHFYKFAGTETWGLVPEQAYSGGGSGWIVSGAGDTSYNGTYIQNGTFNGKPAYEKQGGGRWLYFGYYDCAMSYFWTLNVNKYNGCDPFMDAPYYDGTGEAPSGSWYTSDWGTPPAPTVAQGGGGATEFQIVSAVLNDFSGEGYIALMQDDDATGAAQSQYDWVFVRNYTSLEPKINFYAEQKYNLSEHQYRRPITVSYTSGTENLYNYQVLITANTQELISAGKMKNDCSDIRFVKKSKWDGSGWDTSQAPDWQENKWEISYPYWIESGCNTTSTKIWVKVDSVPYGEESTIYMYYGNSSALSESNGIDTFDFFDTGDQISNWTSQGTSGQDTSLGNPSPSYKAAGSPGSYMYRDIGLTTNKIFEYDVYSSVLGDTYFLVNSSGSGQNFRIDTRSGTSCGIGSTSSWTSWGSISKTCAYVSANTWHKFKLVIGQTTAQAYINGNTCGGAYTFSNKGTYIGLVGDGGGGQTNWDNLRVRKYASIEPTTSVGTESQKP